MADHILVPTAPGELIDKLTILRLKEERITDPAKVANVRVEKVALMKTADAHVPSSADLDVLWEALYKINADLWVIEDDIRNCERAKNFGEEFVRLAPNPSGIVAAIAVLEQCFRGYGAAAHRVRKYQPIIEGQKLKGFRLTKVS